MSEDIQEEYIEYSATLAELIDMESSMHNKRRLLHDLKNRLLSNEDNNGSCGIEFSDHAFKQISERLEELASINPIIYDDVFRDGIPSKSLLNPSNLKSFIITLIANAKKNNDFSEDESKSKGAEFRYKIDMKKWSNSKSLQFIAIVENNKIKSGWFNWV